MRTLVDEGVLAMDRRSATYLPTAQFAMLGHWLADSWRSNHHLLDAFKLLVLDTGETTSPAVPSDLSMEIVQAINAPGSSRWSAEVGQRHTAFASAAGAARAAADRPAVAGLRGRA